MRKEDIYSVCLTPEPKVISCTVNEILDHIVNKYGSKKAIIEGKNYISYSELNYRSNQIGRYLRKKGVKRNDLISILIDNSIDTIAAILGVIKSGAAYVPINPDDSVSRQNYIYQNSESKYLLVNNTSKAAFDCACISIDDAVITGENGKNMEIINQQSDLLYLLYTSGSTGSPKGAMIEHRNLVYQFHYLGEEFGFNSSDIWTLFHTYSFDFSVLEIFGALYFGGSLVIVPKEIKGDRTKLLELLCNEKVTVTGFVPSVFYNLAGADLYQIDLKVRYVILGGEKLNFNKLKSWAAAFPDLKIINGYGLTETTVFNTGKHVDLDGISTGISNIGKPFTPNQIYLMDGLKLCKIGEKGEICIGGYAVARGYWKNDQLNREKFIVNPFNSDGRLYRTGDIGRMDPLTGDIEFIGRLDNQIKIRGYRVELEEIESIISQLSIVKHAAVKAFENENKTGSVLAAYIVFNKQESIRALETVKEYTAGKLPGYMVPSNWIELTDMPLTNRGKADKSKLLKPEDRRKGLSSQYKGVATELQREICNIWADQLETDDIGIYDSYYELGGHSLSLINMLNTIKETYQTDIKVPLFIENPTIYVLAKAIEANQNEKNPEILLDPQHEYEINSPFPLTDLQQAFFIGRQADIELGDCASHSYVELECSEYNHEKFLTAVEKLTARHDMLRCRFTDTGEQIVLPVIKEMPVFITDLTMHDSRSQRQYIVQKRRELENQVLDYKNAPLFTFNVTKLNEQNVIIHFYLDALIADGWSHEILLSELDQFYQNPDLQKSSLKYSFRHYVDYYQQIKHTHKYEEAKQFWVNKIKILPGNPDLPMKNSPASLKCIKSKQLKKSISVHTWGKIEKAANYMGVSTFIVMLTAFCKVIARYSKSQRFMINIPVSNRPDIHSDINSIIGVCSNFFLFDYENIKDESMKQTAKRVQQQMWEIKDHEFFSGTEVVREIYRTTGEIGGFIATIVFTSLLDIPVKKRNMFHRSYLETHTSQIWMDTVVMREDDVISFNWDYVEGLIDSNVLKNIFSGYLRLLEDLANNYNSWDKLTCIPINNKEYSIIQKMNDSETVWDYQPLNRVLSQNFIRFKDNTAIVANSTVLSYDQLKQKVISLADKMFKMGVEKGDGIAIVTDKKWYQITAILSAVYLGCYYIPVEAELAAESINFCISDAEGKIILTDLNNIERIAVNEGIKVLNVETYDYLDVKKEIEPAAVQIDDLLAVIYTSGSTGRPKGIKLRQKGLLNALYFTNTEYHVSEHDSAIGLTSISHDMSLYDIFGLLMAGGTIVLPDAYQYKDPEHWLTLIKKFNITIWNSVPAFMEMLLSLEGTKDLSALNSVRLFIHGGDFLKPQVVKKVRELSANSQIINVGGPTETTLWSVYHEITAEDIKQEKIPYGKAITNMKHFILNDNMELCPVSVKGTIYSAGVGVAKGYVKLPQLTAKRFTKWNEMKVYNTGDLGYYLPTGEMAIIGREDNQIKISGKRIELEGIQTIINRFDMIQNCIVIYHKERKALIAYYMSDRDISKEEFTQMASAELPAYMIPKFIYRIDQMPLNRSGKIDKAALPNPVIEAPAKAADFDKEDGIAGELCSFCRTLLSNESIDEASNFFMEGGNSISAIQLLAHIRETYHIDITLGELFKEPTIKDWHQLIITSTDKADPSHATKIPLPDLAYPLCSAQSGIWWYDYVNHSNRYTICSYIHINGPVDSRKLELAVQHVLQNHDIFYLEFGIDSEGQPVQSFNSGTSFDSIIKYAEVIGKREAEEYLHKKSDRKFLIMEDRLYELTLLKYADKEFILVLLFHHLLIDEFTLELIRKEIFDNYQKMERKCNALENSYLSYCIARTEQQADLNYWKVKFNNYQPYFLDFSDVEVKNSMVNKYGHVSFNLPAEFNILLDKGAVEGITGFAVGISLFAANLFLASGRDTQYIMTSFSDRAGYGNCMGMFVHNNLLRFLIHYDESFMQIMHSVNKEIIDVHEHNSHAYNDIIRRLSLDTGLLELQNQIVFTYIDNKRESEYYDNLLIEPIQIIKSGEKNKLTFILEKIENIYTVYMEYDLSWMSLSTANFIKDTYIKLIHYFAADIYHLIGNMLISDGSRNEQKETPEKMIENFF